MSLSQSFYPLLQTAEVALRNSLYFAIAQDLQDEFWLLNQHENFLHPSEEKKLIEIREKLRASRCTDIHHLISESSFGFWTNLLNQRYEQILWPRLLTKVFPYLPRACRSRDFVHKRFRDIRELRNHVFHHQRIFHWYNLKTHHRYLIETIGWLEPELISLLETIDQFSEIYHNGKKNILNSFK